jgi:uncharacterized cupredoxin-like copper-binding protein
VFRIRTGLVVLGILTAALAIAACGSSKKKSTSSSAAAPPPATSTATSASSSSAAAGGGAGGQTVKLSADPSGALAFNTTKLSAKAGSVTIQMHNPSSLQHAIAVEGNGVDKDASPVGSGGTATLTVKLKPGTYTFYCPVDGHRAAGMKGTLTVT